MALPYVMLLCLTVTIMIELLFALILKIHDKTDLINVVLVNILTNPLLVSTLYLVFLKYGEFAKIVFEIIMEIVIFAVEGTIYKRYLKYNKINPYLTSLILNISSYFTGGIVINKICQNFALFNI